MQFCLLLPEENRTSIVYIYKGESKPRYCYRSGRARTEHQVAAREPRNVHRIIAGPALRPLKSSLFARSRRVVRRSVRVFVLHREHLLRQGHCLGRDWGHSDTGTGTGGWFGSVRSLCISVSCWQWLRFSMLILIVISHTHTQINTLGTYLDLGSGKFCR